MRIKYVLSALELLCGYIYHIQHFFTFFEPPHPPKFLDYATAVVAFADKDATTALNAMQSFAAGTVTSYALDTNARWPNVTIPNFEMRGSTSNEISQALQMTLSPLVAAFSEHFLVAKAASERPRV